tara:strand:- start:1827 stop:1991 length:165 start_codon:yes stop_codon:yes gene_type:complete
MGTGAWIATIVSGLGFAILFGIASAKGDFHGLIDTTLKNDQINREKKIKLNKNT